MTDMVSVADLFEKLLTRCGNELILCSFMQFTEWYKNICITGEAQEAEEYVGPKITNTVQKRVCKVDIHVG